MNKKRIMITTSIAVFVSSAKTINSKLEINTACLKKQIGKNNVIIVKITNISTSCLNASSLLKADIKPSYEYLKAFKILGIPLLVDFIFYLSSIKNYS